ncbi:ras-related protein Rap-2a-like [Tachypleus tridentatus]|uniref:ras-related protein Rap-2a-like n=1 Tax=Tachypleus tridentatus TaxID=6853 RepID=UPI003FD6A154
MTSTRERVSVLVVGCTDVGKSSLTNQFSTSEYICTYDCSLEEKNETSVTVVLNEEEYDLLFIEKTVATETVTSLLNLSVASYVVVYSVVDRTSFQWAKNFISQVVKCVDTMNKALILVGNKTDLVRLRKVSPEEGRSVAASHGFKFIEISTGINHNVDELLVGILNQIRLKRHRVEEMKSGAVVSENPGGRFVGCTGWRTKSIIKRILRRSRVRRSSSCDNFNTL